MRKFLEGSDGERHELSPLSYKEFVVFNHWNHSSTSAYQSWLQRNNLVEAEDFRDDYLQYCRLVLVNTPRTYEFDINGTDNWKIMDLTQCAAPEVDRYTLRLLGCLLLNERN